MTDHDSTMESLAQSSHRRLLFWSDFSYFVLCTSYFVLRAFCCHHSHKFAEPRHGSTWSSQCTREHSFHVWSFSYCFSVRLRLLIIVSTKQKKKRKNEEVRRWYRHSLLFHLQVRDQVWDKEEPVLLSSRGSCPDWRRCLSCIQWSHSVEDINFWLFLQQRLLDEWRRGLCSHVLSRSLRPEVRWNAWGSTFFACLNSTIPRRNLRERSRILLVWFFNELGCNSVKNDGWRSVGFFEV